MLKENSKAPDFTLSGSDGKMHQLSSVKNKLTVVYFYPKDDTPGCTREACDFRDNLENIASRQCNVYGISRDNISSHEKFKSKYHLNFVLLSDPDLKTHTDYGVLNDTKVNRSTFLINQAGNILKIWHNVKVDGHVQEVLQAIEAFS